MHRLLAGQAPPATQTHAYQRARCLAFRCACICGTDGACHASTMCESCTTTAAAYLSGTPGSMSESQTTHKSLSFKARLTNLPTAAARRAHIGPSCACTPDSKEHCPLVCMRWVVRIRACLAAAVSLFWLSLQQLKCKRWCAALLQSLSACLAWAKGVAGSSSASEWAAAARPQAGLGSAARVAGAALGAVSSLAAARRCQRACCDSTVRSKQAHCLEMHVSILLDKSPRPSTLCQPHSGAQGL